MGKKNRESWVGCQRVIINKQKTFYNLELFTIMSPHDYIIEISM